MFISNRAAVKAVSVLQYLGSISGQAAIAFHSSYILPGQGLEAPQGLPRASSKHCSLGAASLPAAPAPVRVPVPSSPAPSHSKAIVTVSKLRKELPAPGPAELPRCRLCCSLAQCMAQVQCGQQQSCRAQCQGQTSLPVLTPQPCRAQRWRPGLSRAL